MNPRIPCPAVVWVLLYHRSCSPWGSRYGVRNLGHLVGWLKTERALIRQSRGYRPDPYRPGNWAGWSRYLSPRSVSVVLRPSFRAVRKVSRGVSRSFGAFRSSSMSTGKFVVNRPSMAKRRRRAGGGLGVRVTVLWWVPQMSRLNCSWVLFG
jgi:hypothetical protein